MQRGASVIGRAREEEQPQKKLPPTASPHGHPSSSSRDERQLRRPRCYMTRCPVNVNLGDVTHIPPLEARRGGLPSIHLTFNMAPATNSAKALQQNRPRPAVPRTVVPAIPLPYVQKRQQQEAARARAREEAAAPTVVETPEPSSPASTTAHISPAIVNGSSKSHAAERAEESTEVASPTTPATPATPALEESSQASEVEETEASVQDTTTGEQTKFATPYRMSPLTS